MISRDDPEKLKLLREDAERGIARAQRLLALRFLRGRGVPPDSGLALHWLRRAADQGLALAQRDLAALLEQGGGINRDITEAHRLYRLAAAQGDPIACARLRDLNGGADE